MLVIAFIVHGKTYMYARARGVPCWCTGTAIWSDWHQDDNILGI